MTKSTLTEETSWCLPTSNWVNTVITTHPYSEEGLYDFVWYEKESGEVLMDEKIVAKSIEILKQKALIAFIQEFPNLAKCIEEYKLKFRKWS